ncbi:unnamed protein product [Ceutorhynchus assimilis]|uniref:Uncharacterized protein n=1 Tax=Ceutorhynchus assimilis TaxID=467358 RepID=A0A9N9QMF6_9CUCU|nr:unnamed protein product [Ceutorhynchus assimilis]
MVVNIMVEKYGTDIHKNVKIDFAKAIVCLFPCYRTISEKGGYETFYNPDTGAGFLAWRLRTIKRNSPKQRKPATKRKQSCELNTTTKKSRTEPPDVEVAEMVQFMKNALPDQKEIIIKKMKLTFEYRRSIVKDTTSVLLEFPRFMDTPDLINNDFTQLLPNCPSLEDFIIIFGEKILSIYKNLETAESSVTGEEESEVEIWDRDTRIFLAVLFMLPPTARGRKKVERIPIKELPNCLIIFCKRGRPLQEIIDSRSTKQPIVIACGPNKAAIDYYVLSVDGNILQPEIHRSVDALDLLFNTFTVLRPIYGS